MFVANKTPVFFLMLLSFFAISCNSPKETPFKQELLSIVSKVYKEERTLYVQLPKSYYEKGTPKKKYPLIVVLDGDQYFSYLSGLVQILADKEYMPETILVAIPPKNRNKELTPPILGDPNSGAADQFLQFFEKELLPFLYNQYPLLDHKTIVGHSFGGLWALSALFDHSHLFDYYLTSDASYTYYPKKNSKIELVDSKSKRLFLAIANTLPKGRDTFDFIPSGSEQHLLDLFSLRDKIVQGTSKQIQMEWKYYSEYDHTKVMIPAYEDGLKSLFSWYPMDKEQLSKRDNPELTKGEILAAFEKYIQGLKNELGAEAIPDENQFNRVIGYNHGTDERLTMQLLQLHHKYYPQSFNANQALGLFYFHKKENKKAAHYLQKALEIREDSLTETMLKQLDL